MNKPLVTVAIPAYKGTYLKEAIDSILNQVYPDIELIIVNDQSPENIEAIVKSYNDERIKYYVNEHNIGAEDPANNWNKCLSLSSGSFFCMLCDDDIYKPTFVEEMLKLATEYPESNVFRARCGTINKNGQVIDLYPTSPQWETSEDYMHHVFQKLRRQTISEFFYRTDYIKSQGGFVHLPLAWNADYLSIFSFSKSGGIASTYKPLVFFRMSGENISSTNTSNGLKKAQANYEAYIKAKDLIKKSDDDMRPLLQKTVASWKYLIDSNLICLLSPIERLKVIKSRRKFQISAKAIIRGIVLGLI